MADVKWIKIMTDIFDDEKFLIMDAMPNSDTLELMWFKLLVFAGRSNNGGIFMFNDIMAYTDEMLASVFRRPISTVRNALEKFEELGMIVYVENVLTIPKWSKYQSLDVYDKKKEQDRERAKRYRERQKALIEEKTSRDESRDNHVNSFLLSNSISNSSSVSNKSNKSNKDNNISILNKVLLSNTEYKELLDNNMLLDITEEWLKYKDEQKDHYKETSIKTLVKKIIQAGQEYGSKAVTDCIEESISSGYKGIIWDKLKKAGSSGSAYLDRIDNRISDVDKWAAEIEERHRQKGESVDDFFGI